jgi:uncharacterized protein (DUF342 family)
MTYSINNTMNSTYIGDPLTVSTTSAPGQVYTTTGTGNLQWGNLNGTSTSWATLSADPNLQGSTLKVKGDADFDGEVTIKGKSLTDMIEKIEERLAILHPNIELEDKWDELKELGKRYKELEAEIIEKEKVWAILKK